MTDPVIRLIPRAELARMVNMSERHLRRVLALGVDLLRLLLTLDLNYFFRMVVSAGYLLTCVSTRR